MMPPDLADGKCQELSPEKLEETFWYPGPQDVAKTPGGPALAAWEAAKEVCIECPVFLMCRESAWGQEYGVAGGTDQHERHLYRRRLTRLLTQKSDADRAAMAAHFHARHAGGLGDSPELMARSTGYSSQSIKAMIQEHQDLIDAEREQRSGALPVRDLADWEDVPSFPEQDPSHGDGWVWYFGRAHKGHYVAETADGTFVRMKIKPTRAQTVKWLPVSHVDLRRAVDPVIQSWVGRPDGVQEKAQDDQRPGQQAADAA